MCEMEDVVYLLAVLNVEVSYMVVISCRFSAVSNYSIRLVISQVASLRPHLFFF